MTSNIQFESPWRFWHGVGILASAMTLYALLSWAHMELVRQTVGFDAYLGAGPRLPAHVLVTGQWIKAVALLAVLALLARTSGRLDWRALGLRRVGIFWIVLASGLAVGLFGFRLLLAKAIAITLPGWADFMPAPFVFSGEANLLFSLMFLVTTILVTPFAEEIFFRGFLFKWMSGHRPIWLAALVSSTLFGVMHILPPQAISAALLALVLCWLYWRTGSIWPAIAAHVVNNALGVLIGASGLAGLTAG